MKTAIPTATPAIAPGVCNVELKLLAVAVDLAVVEDEDAEDEEIVVGRFVEEDEDTVGGGATSRSATS